jgi:hypothetical protein
MLVTWDVDWTKKTLPKRDSSGCKQVEELIEVTLVLIRHGTLLHEFMDHKESKRSINFICIN